MTEDVSKTVEPQDIDADMVAPETVENPESVEPEAVNNEDQTPLYNKRQVADVVKRERLRAYEKGKREALMQQDMQQQAPEMGGMGQQQQPVQQTQGNLGGMPQMSEEQIRQLIAQQVPQHLQQQAQEYQSKQFVDSFVNKMQAAEQKYPGLEEKLNNLDWSKPKTRAIVEMANSLENTGDIMNELIDNPEKMGIILNLVDEQPFLAKQKLMSLSNSIKQNEAATAQHQSTNAPLSQMKPSANAGMADGAMSVSDFSKMFRNKRS